jgi:Tol biopolymer transport system component
MPLRGGTYFGAYEIRALEGIGGMGEVYRARDTKLNRDVALKILPEHFAANPRRLARFTREARVLASLNHSNIAAVYGIEEANDVGQALILEWVYGDTLAERIAHGPIPVTEAIRIAKQIAEALDAAHEHGIVHRDLKPANIKLRSDGTVKVLDFGLAKVLEPSLEDDDVKATTVAAPATQIGVAVGTVPYMSPEQARGQKVDKRTDIWAFGCVLYEMLTGRGPFDRRTAPDTLVAVLAGVPSLDPIPERLRPLLRRCLEADPRRRLRDIGDAMPLLDDAPEVSSVRRAPAVTRWLWPGVAALLALTTAAVFVASRRGNPVAVHQVRFQIMAPEGATDFNAPFALSPDGRSLAFIARSAAAPDRGVLWVHSLDSGEWRQLPGGPSVTSGPVWSPDSRFIAFYAEGKLRKIDVSSGLVQAIADLAGVNGYISAAWDSDGLIVIGGPRGLMRVSAAGGTLVPLTVTDPARNEVGHAMPRFLPDGRHFVYYRMSLAPETQGIYIGSVDAKPEEQRATRLVATLSGAAYMPSAEDPGNGHLLYVRDGTLMAQRFDTGRLELTGEATPVAEHVGESDGPAGRTAHFSVAETGAVAYRHQERIEGRPVWVDRSGRELAALVQAPLDRPSNPRLSPDGRRLALFVGGKLWVYDLAGRPPIKLTADGEGDLPLWTRDGSRLVYASNTQPQGLVSVPADSQGGTPERVSPMGHYHPHGWSADGQEMVVVLNSYSTKTKWDILKLPAREKAEPQPVVRTSSSEGDAGVSLSPDSRWLAYSSNATGAQEIWVQPYPGPGSPIRVSPNGGADPLWSRDGQELYYLENNKLMSVAVDTRSGFEFKAPTLLFASPYVHTRFPNKSYDVAPDGRFLMIKAAAPSPESSAITMVLNWGALLTK